MDASFTDLAEEQISTSPGCLMNAFEYVIETAGRRQVTDLHVRRLLKYVCAHDRNYTGVKVSLAQLASILFLSVPTCRRVIRRAVKEFNLLIVIPQRYHPGGQTVNRYTINWDNVDAVLYDMELAHCATLDANNDSPPTNNNMPPAPDDMPPKVTPSRVFARATRKLEEFLASLASKHLSPEVTPDLRTEGPANCLAQASPVLCLSCYDLAPAQRDAGLGTSSPNDLGGLKARPFAKNNCEAHSTQTHAEPETSSTNDSSTQSSTREEDLERLIFEDRLLSCHPRVLRIPERLIPKVWPYAVRRYPKETPLELLAHLNVLIFKLKTAMDRAQKLKSKKLFYRLRTLLFKLQATHRRASYGAMCRTNLPPPKPLPEYSRHSSPIDHPTNDDTPDPSSLDNCRSGSDNCQSGSDPVALSNQPSSESSDSLSAHSLQPESPAPCSLTPEASSLLNSLLSALDELLAHLNVALQSARDHRSYWIQNDFTTLRRSIKTIRKRATAFSPNISSHTQENSHLPSPLAREGHTHTFLLPSPLEGEGLGLRGSSSTISKATDPNAL